MHGKVRQQLVAWSKGEVACLEHAVSAFANDWLSQNMQAADHGIGFPMSQVLDDIGIGIGIEEGCGTPCPQQPGTDFFWGNVKLNSIRQDQVDDSTQHGGHVLSCDMMGLRWGL